MDVPAPQPLQRLLKPNAVVIAAILAVLALQLPLVINRAINWDEFWHYSQTMLLAKGQLTAPLQTLYTRAFAWVTTLDGTGVDHIVVIRVFMLACEIVTLLAIVGLAARFSDRVTALLCALAYLTASYVFQHGTSFRFDPPAAALLTSSLWIVACKPLRAIWLATVAVLLGACAMLTIKSVLYAPAFAGIAWLRWSEAGFRRETIVRLATLPFATAAAFGLIYLLHSQGLAGDTGIAAETVVSRSANKMFSIGIPSYWWASVRAAIFSPVQAVMILIVPVALIRSDRTAAERIALLGLWLPVTTLLFYHNTAPYYHVFMLAPVCISLAVVIPPVVRRYGAVFLAGVFVAGALLTFARESESRIDRQRVLLTAADRIFGGPVAYFDSCAMLGSFVKANAFMTPWGIDQYLAGGFPAMTETLKTQVVPLVVDDDIMFTQALRERGAVPTLLPQDTEMLRSTYRHFWGPFWIAGFQLAPAGNERQIPVRVPGPYTLRANSTVVIDGQLRKPDEVFELARGMHRIGPASHDVRLTWGRNLQAPREAAPIEPYFTFF